MKEWYEFRYWPDDANARCGGGFPPCLISDRIWHEQVVVKNRLIQGTHVTAEPLRKFATQNRAIWRHMERHYLVRGSLDPSLRQHLARS